MLGDLYVGAGRWEEALHQFEQVAAREPRSVSVHTMIGMILQAQQRIDEAKRRYEQALALGPDAVAASNNLAWLLAEEGSDLDRAVRLASHATERQPEAAEYHHTLGWVHVKRHLPALAIPSLERAVELAPDNPTFRYHLGLAYEAAGDTGRARTAFEKALALDASFSGAGDAEVRLVSLRGSVRPRPR
jgi:Flp pilus assembly protein TadD